MRLLADALSPLALGAAVAVVLSACAVPHAPAAATAPSLKATPTGSTGVPPTIADPPAPGAATGQLAEPARPASEKVPATARAVTISMDLGPSQGGTRPPTPVTITGRAQVSALTALINGLARFPPGAFNCPADHGDDLVLTFRAGPRTPALAVATVDLAGSTAWISPSTASRSGPCPPGDRQRPRGPETAGLAWKIPPARPA